MHDKTRLIVAEDDADHQRLLLSALGEGSPTLDVCMVATLEELQSALRSGRYDGLLLDYHLGEHTAPDVLRTIQPLLGATPVVVTSASEEQRVVIQSLRMGVADFVPKDRAMRGGRALWDRIQAAIAERRAKTEGRRVADRRLRALQRVANHDPLTGLYNRRYGVSVLNSDRLRRDRRGDVACTVIDIDGFKRINDEHGHDAGDKVLRHIAHLIRRHSPPGEAAIRWGGDEFLLFRSACTLTDAWVRADDLRRLIASTAVPHAGTTLRVTLSAGVTTVPPSAMCEETIRLADRALYLAKEHGRDRVCTWPMVCAMEAAEHVQSDPRTPRDRRGEGLVAALRLTLGQTQIEHAGPHGRRVREIAQPVAHALGFTGESIERLATAADLHDLGKVGIPESLLAKPSRLSLDERRLVGEHARFGADLVRAIGVSDRVADIVAHHHDRFDQTARLTPDRGEDVRLSFIVATADAMATMTATRPYAPVRTTGEALAVLRGERGRQFDPTVVDAFHAVSDAGGWIRAAA